MAKQFSGVFADAGVAAMVDLSFYPFGNAYWPTKKCPGPSAKTGIHCWAPECGTPGKEPAAECFTGVPSCQHGKAECEANSMEACVIKHYPNATQYWPFVDCFEVKGDSKVSGAQACAKKAGLSWSTINGCFSDPAQRNAVDVEMAKATLAHNCNTPDQPSAKCRSLFETPDVYVNDKQVEGKLLTAICSAITGPKPPSCGGA